MKTEREKFLNLSINIRNNTYFYCIYKANALYDQALESYKFC